MAKEVVLTGLRSNAEFHIGNYLGAILPMVELQEKHAGQYQLNMFIPDLHSFTTPIEHGKLYEQSIKNLKVFVAAGLDIDQSDTFIYRQSYIPAHSELTWILDCFSYFGELSRMTEFKNKSALNEEFDLTEIYSTLYSFDDVKNLEYLKNKIHEIAKKIEQLELTRDEQMKRISVGLFNYPILMAADILLYGAKWVPVGEDQRQHVEFTRDLATRMNNKFGELFVLPEDNKKQTEFAGRNEPVRIRSLRNPDKKMSKSVQDPAGTIMLSDDPDDAAKKIMGATTDSVGKINYDFANQSGISNLLQILALLSNLPQDQINSQWSGKSSYDELKTEVADKVRTFLKDLQAKLTSINDQQILSKLEDDEKAMTNVANNTLHKVQQAVGLRPRA